jgi:hypothetical protein
LRISSRRSAPLFITGKNQNLDTTGINIGLEKQGVVFMTAKATESKKLLIFKTRNRKILKSIDIPLRPFQIIR